MRAGNRKVALMLRGAVLAVLAALGPGIVAPAAVAAPRAAAVSGATATATASASASTTAHAICVPNDGSGTVSFATATAVTATIPAGPRPLMCAVSPDGTQAYAVNSDTATVTVVDVVSQTAVATIPVGASPRAAAFTPDGSKAYVTNDTDDSVSVIDVATRTVTATIAVQPYPWGLAVSPDGTKVLVADQGGDGNSSSGFISVIDVASDSVVATIPGGLRPFAVAFAPNGLRAYVANVGGGTVSVVGVAQNAIVGTIAVGANPSTVAVSPDGTRAYVTNNGADQSTIGTLSDIDLTNGTTSFLHIGYEPYAVVFSPDGSQAYVTNAGSSLVSVINVATGENVAEISGFGNTPSFLSAFPDQTCPCTVFPTTATPAAADAGDGSSVELGVKVQVATAGDITGVRFYKAAANTGPHTGSLWSADGTLLATGTFSAETASGWQTLAFANPVPAKPGAVYVASYHAPNGHYSADGGFFAASGSGSGPITALADSAGGDGVYAYGSTSEFPASSYNATNYWVDAVFTTAGVPTAPPSVTAVVPAAKATGVATTSGLSATFSAAVDPATVAFSVIDPSGARVPGVTSYDSASRTATFTPGTQLPFSTVFNASVGASDVWGHAMGSPSTWTFTTGTTSPAFSCPCSLFGTGAGATPAVGDSGDANGVELGVRFTPSVDGAVTGVRFYQDPSNAGVHTGSLWGSDGTLLATGTFAGGAGSGSGWQTLTFASPVPVTAGATYTASYYAPAGDYSYTAGYFSYQHIAYPLTASQGTYAYSGVSTYPADSGGGTNYWVDPVFVPAS